MYMYQRKLLKWRILYFSFLTKFDKNPCTIVQGLWPDFGATLKIHKKSNFDQNHLKLETQHKNMYICFRKNIKMENSLFDIFAKSSPRHCTISNVVALLSRIHPIVHGLWPDFESFQT